jgi:hypothetical protein
MNLGFLNCHVFKVDNNKIFHILHMRPRQRKSFLCISRACVPSLAKGGPWRLNIPGDLCHHINMVRCGKCVERLVFAVLCLICLTVAGPGSKALGQERTDTVTAGPLPVLDAVGVERFRIGGLVSIAGAPLAPDVAGKDAAPGGVYDAAVFLATASWEFVPRLSARLAAGGLLQAISTDPGCNGGSYFTPGGCTWTKMFAFVWGGGLDYTWRLGSGPFGVGLGAGLLHMPGADFEIGTAGSDASLRETISGVVPYVETLFRLYGPRGNLSVGFRMDFSLARPEEAEGDWGFWHFYGVVGFEYALLTLLTGGSQRTAGRPLRAVPSDHSLNVETGLDPEYVHERAKRRHQLWLWSSVGVLGTAALGSAVSYSFWGVETGRGDDAHDAYLGALTQQDADDWRGKVEDHQASARKWATAGHVATGIALVAGGSALLAWLNPPQLPVPGPEAPVASVRLLPLTSGELVGAGVEWTY